MKYVAILVPAAIILLIGLVALWRGEQERLEEEAKANEKT